MQYRAVVRRCLVQPILLSTPPPTHPSSFHSCPSWQLPTIKPHGKSAHWAEVRDMSREEHLFYPITRSPAHSSHCTALSSQVSPFSPSTHPHSPPKLFTPSPDIPPSLLRVLLNKASELLSPCAIVCVCVCAHGWCECVPYAAPSTVTPH